MVLLKRIIASVVGFPIVAALVIVGKTPLLIGVFILAVVGMSEMYAATMGKKDKPLCVVSYAFTAIYYIMIGNTDSFLSSQFLALQEHFSVFFLAFAALFIITLLVILVALYPNISFSECAITLTGFFYVAFLLSFIYLVRQYVYGSYFVWLIFISAWGCDTFAYFTGKALGKHKLTPLLSPKKTIEGAVGGTLGAAILAMIYGLVISGFSPLPKIPVILFCTLAATVGAIFAQFGDLAASAIKRSTGIKDYGSIIPGHGGIMDRFDSILFTAPIIYILMFGLLNFIAKI